MDVASSERFWPERWWRLIDFRIGIIPLPIYVVLVALVATLVFTGEMRSDGPTMIAVLVLGGFTCAEIGKRIPILRNIGAGAIFATFIPSALAYYHLIPAKMESSIIEFTKSTNFLYIFIASIIVGSILGMDREVLIKGFLKVFVRWWGRRSGSVPIIPSSMSSCRSWPAASERAPFPCRLVTPR
jgi:malate:Na+ symporter